MRYLSFIGFFLFALGFGMVSAQEDVSLLPAPGRDASAPVSKSSGADEVVVLKLSDEVSNAENKNQAKQTSGSNDASAKKEPKPAVNVNANSNPPVAKPIAASQPKTLASNKEKDQKPIPAELKEPDKDGIVMLVRLVELNASALNNPFEIRVQPTIATVDTVIEVGGIIRGYTEGQHTAIVNGRVYSQGDMVDGFKIYLILEKSIIVEYNNKYVNIPRDRKITLRLPQS